MFGKPHMPAPAAAASQPLPTSTPPHERPRTIRRAIGTEDPASRIYAAAFSAALGYATDEESIETAIGVARRAVIDFAQLLDREVYPDGEE